MHGASDQQMIGDTIGVHFDRNAARFGDRPGLIVRQQGINWTWSELAAQVDAFAAASPIQQGDGSRAAMGFALLTGDQTDSAQRNEAIWVRQLLEGGTTLNPNSGVTDTANPSAYNPTAHPSCAPYSLPPPPGGFENPPSEAPLYTGVQDYTDYGEGNILLPQYYDPSDVRGTWATAGWPT
jgi:hypothetical protein